MDQDFEAVDQAITMLESAEVVQEFEDTVWIKVERSDWEAFNHAFKQEAL